MTKRNSYYVISTKEWVQCELVDIDECEKYYRNPKVDVNPPIGFGTFVLAKLCTNNIDAKCTFSEDDFLMRSGDTIIASFKTTSVERAIMLWVSNKRLVEPEAVTRLEGYHEQ